MITKDQLDLLKQEQEQPPMPRLTPNGELKDLAHQAVKEHKQAMITKGEQTLSNASEQFQQQMQQRFKGSGMDTRKQNQQQKMTPQTIPVHDRSIAEATWRQNHIDGHIKGFAKADAMLRKAVNQAFPPVPKETVNAKATVEQFATAVRQQTQSQTLKQ